jgi:hypothetical protein
VHRFTRPVVVVAVTLALASLVAVANAQAEVDRVTRAEALEIFRGPLDDEPDLAAQIRVFSGSPWDGRHFCSLDWHVISQAWFEGNQAGESRTTTEIRESLSQVEIALVLDGVPLDTVTTPIRPLLNPERFGFVEALYFQEGRVMAPDDLAVGQHELSVTYLLPGFPPLSDSMTIFIDAPGEGTCL